MSELPPHDLNAEESVLGAMMSSAAQRIRVVNSGLKAHHFYRPSHALIFKSILQVDEDRQPDAVTVIAALGVNVDDAGGAPYVRTLPQLCAVVSNAPHYAQIVMDHAAVRRLGEAAQRIGQIAQGGGEVPEKVAAAEKVMLDAVGDTTRTEMQRIHEAMVPVMQAVAAGQPAPSITTGFKQLDDVIGGLRPGKLLVLAARPGVGKTTLALNIVECASATPAPTAFFSLEMGEAEIGKKLVASLGEVSHRALVMQNPTEAQLKKAREGWMKLRELPILVSDNGNTTVTDIRAKARHLKRTQDLGLVVIDYLQLMSGGNPDNRNLALAEITRSLKQLAGELEIPILLLSQMSRAIEIRKEKRPQLSDLRDSGAIEQDADVVIFIHREDVSKASATDTGLTELIVAKNREGEAGIVNLSFVGGKSKFKSVASATSSSFSSPEAK